MLSHGLDIKSMWVDGCPTHPAILAALLERTTGPVVEFGCGFYSTPIFGALRTEGAFVVESDTRWSAFFKRAYPLLRWRSNAIRPEQVEQTYGPHSRWAVAFVDSRPSAERHRIIRMLAPCTDYIVVHDTEPRRAALYPRVEEELSAFRWRYDFKCYSPHTTVVSDTENLAWLAARFYSMQYDLDSEDIERNHKV